MSVTNSKEQNFVSAVVYLGAGTPDPAPFFSMLAAELEAHFAQYELVAVDDAADKSAVAALRAEGVVTIEDAECVAKSYPEFFEDLESIRIR